MSAILYRARDVWQVFEDADVSDALADGWYVLSPAGHPVSPEPDDSAPVKRKPGRPKKEQE